MWCFCWCIIKIIFFYWNPIPLKSCHHHHHHHHHHHCNEGFEIAPSERIDNFQIILSRHSTVKPRANLPDLPHRWELELPILSTTHAPPFVLAQWGDWLGVSVLHFIVVRFNGPPPLELIHNSSIKHSNVSLPPRSCPTPSQDDWGGWWWIVMEMMENLMPAILIPKWVEHENKIRCRCRRWWRSKRWWRGGRRD